MATAAAMHSKPPIKPKPIALRKCEVSIMQTVVPFSVGIVDGSKRDGGHGKAGDSAAEPIYDDGSSLPIARPRRPRTTAVAVVTRDKTSRSSTLKRLTRHASTSSTTPAQSFDHHADSSSIVQRLIATFGTANGGATNISKATAKVAVASTNAVSTTAVPLLSTHSSERPRPAPRIPAQAGPHDVQQSVTQSKGPSMKRAVGERTVATNCSSPDPEPFRTLALPVAMPTLPNQPIKPPPPVTPAYRCRRRTKRPSARYPARQRSSAETGRLVARGVHNAVGVAQRSSATAGSSRRSSSDEVCASHLLSGADRDQCCLSGIGAYPAAAQEGVASQSELIVRLQPGAELLACSSVGADETSVPVEAARPVAETNRATLEDGSGDSSPVEETATVAIALASKSEVREDLGMPAASCPEVTSKGTETCAHHPTSSAMPGPCSDVGRIVREEACSCKDEADEEWESDADSFDSSSECHSPPNVSAATVLFPSSSVQHAADMGHTSYTLRRCPSKPAKATLAARTRLVAARLRTRFRLYQTRNQSGRPGGQAVAHDRVPSTRARIARFFHANALRRLFNKSARHDETQPVHAGDGASGSFRLHGVHYSYNVTSPSPTSTPDQQFARHRSDLGYLSSFDDSAMPAAKRNTVADLLDARLTSLQHGQAGAAAMPLLHRSAHLASGAMADETPPPLPPPRTSSLVYMPRCSSGSALQPVPALLSGTSSRPASASARGQITLLPEPFRSRSLRSAPELSTSDGNVMASTDVSGCASPGLDRVKLATRRRRLTMPPKLDDAAASVNEDGSELSADGFRKVALSYARSDVTTALQHVAALPRAAVSSGMPTSSTLSVPSSLASEALLELRKSLPPHKEQTDTVTAIDRAPEWRLCSTSSQGSSASSSSGYFSVEFDHPAATSLLQLTENDLEVAATSEDVAAAASGNDDWSTLVDGEPLYQDYQPCTLVQSAKAACTAGQLTASLSPVSSSAGQALLPPVPATTFARWSETPQVIACGVLSEMAPTEVKLQEAMYEVLSSEASYVHSLDVLVNVFAESAVLNDEDVLPVRERHGLFFNIYAVREMSHRLHLELEQHMQESIVLTDVCDIVARYAQREFDLYIKYCSNQVNQAEIIKALSASCPRFVAAIGMLERRPQCRGLSMTSFLLLPMQRVTRYPLLVDAVVRRLEAGTQHESAARNCYETLKRVARKCNEAARTMEQAKQLLALETQLLFTKVKKIPIASASRCLIKKSELVLCGGAGTKIKSRTLTSLLPGATKPNNVTIFLFSDVVIITKKRGDFFSVVDYAARAAVTAEVQSPMGIEAGLRSEGRTAGVSSSAQQHKSSSSATAAKSAALLLLVLLDNHQKKHSEYLLGCSSESERERWLEALAPVSKYGDENERIYEEWDCPQVQAVSDYDTEQTHELSLRTGEVINVLRKMPDGWYEGERISDGRHGWFPSKVTAELPSEHKRVKHLKQRYKVLQAAARRVQHGGVDKPVTVAPVADSAERDTH